MNRARDALAVVALLLSGAALAGCLAAAPSPGAARPSTASDAPAAPALPVDARATLDELRAFAEGFPKRNADNENHNRARDYLAERFEGMGLDVILDELTAPVSPFATPTGVGGSGRLVNVCGLLRGATSDEWVLLGGHYDVTDGAIHGAYDDGSGTVMTVKLAEAFARATTPPARSVVFCAFDGEEQGLRGSSHVAEAISKAEWRVNGTLVAMIDLDMVGIAWPAPSPLVADLGAPELADLVRKLTVDVGYPEGTVEYRGISAGRSDYGPFVATGVPTAFFISAFDDVRYRGQRLPGQYPLWHRLDTYAGMVEFAEGEANLVAGFQNVLDVVSPLVARLAYDPAFTPTFVAPEDA